MGRYNLLDEQWICVMDKETGLSRKVSLKELFAQAEQFDDLAGEMKTQDFAILRFLLAVLHTVFSRFRPDGSGYEYFEIDEDTFEQKSLLAEDDLEDYQDDLYDTWFTLWESGKFPEIVLEYLEKWRGHFYLFDEKYPFYQIKMSEMEKVAQGGGEFYGKNMNRLISESNNKVALFAPKAAAGSNKDHLEMDALVRWLIALQGYTGTAEKKKVRETKLTCSKGWLFDLGGLYIKGANLFQTLMLNCVLVYQEGDNQLHLQIPAWERSGPAHMEAYFQKKVDNLASLYTSWSRVIAFKQDYDGAGPVSCFLAKLPEIEHADAFLEPMTIWTYNQSGPNKGSYTPRKHREGQAMWRNFGLVMGVGENQRRPGVLSWFSELMEEAKDRGTELSKERTGLCAVSMQDDENATSWAPVDQIADEIYMDNHILSEKVSGGWISYIDTIVTDTKEKINTILGRYLMDISQIRGKDPKDRTLIQEGIREFYYRIDGNFRDWLDGITEQSEKEGKALEWKEVLKGALSDFGAGIYRRAEYRDFTGIAGDGKTKNIATAYNYFRSCLNKAFA